MIFCDRKEAWSVSDSTSRVMVFMRALISLSLLNWVATLARKPVMRCNVSRLSRIFETMTSLRPMA